MVLMLQSGLEYVVEMSIFNVQIMQSRVTVPGLSTLSLILLNICVKFHQNISNGFLVMEWTRFCDRQTDRQTDRLQMPMAISGDNGALQKLSKFLAKKKQSF